MRLIDLHCDTLYKSVVNNLPLDDASMDVKVLNSENDYHKLQCYAIWIPDYFTGDKAEELFFKAEKRLAEECRRCNISLIGKNDKIVDVFHNNKNSAYFTVENGLALNGKIENIKRFSEAGVKMITLTWNEKNPIGDGADVLSPEGITPFGRRAVAEMEKYNIIVDVSHASDKLFYDVAEISNRPFVASHSNSREVTAHRRNLTDEQFQIISENGGIVGINFYKEFLSDNPEKSNKYDILRHTEHFLALGGENTVCFGSDFDGCDLPIDIVSSLQMNEIYEMFLRHNYKESLVRKIFYENALKFFENFDNQRIM